MIAAGKPGNLRPILVGLLLACLVLGLATLGYLYALTPAPMLAAARAHALPAPAVTGSWDHYAADADATQYSPLSQITPANVNRLRVAWTYRTGEMEKPANGNGLRAFANTPILAAGSLIVCTPQNRVIALDPASGAERWRFDPHMQLKESSFGKYVCRGVAFYHDPAAPPAAACADRLIYGTNDLRVIALDARTGRSCEGFGVNGEVQVDVPGRLYPSEEQFTAPPAIVGDVAVLGNAVQDGSRVAAPHGIVRAFDVHTGALRWSFDPIPSDPADPAWATWQNGSAHGQGGGNVWADMAVDVPRGLIFLPTSAPMIENQGNTRPGNNLYANSVVALEGSTGKMVWHYQVVHHDVWDYDLPAAPLLTDLQVGRTTIPALIQTTKMGLVFVFDRRDGTPIFPIEERPAPQGDGQYWLSPTQPIPQTMPSLAGRQITPDDAWGFTPWDTGWCRRHLAASYAPGLYAPPTRQGTLIYPTASGGSNLGQRAYDPQRKVLIANTIRTAMVTGLFRPGGLSGGGLLSPLGVPCIAPPWGLLTALDIEHQKILWQVPLGSLEELAPLPIPLKYGVPSRGGPMATGGGLVFIAGTMDQAFRAFDTDTGQEVWKVHLPAGGQATPMTYLANGRQFVVLADGGHGWMKTREGDYVIAYALP